MEAGDTFDITIIGAGPSGLFGAFYAGMRKLSTKIIEALPVPGGQLGVLYPEKTIYDVPGYPEIRADELIRQHVVQLKRFPITYCYDETVQTFNRNDDGTFVVQTDKATHNTRALVITTGIGAFAPTKLKAIGAAQFEGNGLSYTLGDPGRYQGKRTLVVGGSEEAAGWALKLAPVAAQVMLIHHKPTLKVGPEWLTDLERAGVEARTNFQIQSIESNGGSEIGRVTLLNPQTKQTETLPVDAIIASTGYKSNLRLMYGWGLNAQKRYIPVNAKMETNIPGVYAAGGVVAPEGAEPLDLISTAYGQAAVAVNQAATYIDSKANLFPGHSSEEKFFG